MNIDPIDPNGIYICVEPFGTSDGLAPKLGERLRGSHAAVQRRPIAFVRDGATSEDVARRRSEIASAALAATSVAQVEAPRPTSPRDEVICIRACETSWRRAGEPLMAAPGDRLPKTTRLVEQHPECFRPVVPPGLRRRDAVVATTDMREVTPDGASRWVLTGEWLHKSDSLAVVNWQHVVSPPLPQPGDPDADEEKPSRSARLKDLIPGRRKARERKPLVAFVGSGREEAD